MGEKIGYARVSTREQTTDGQVRALREAGCKRIYTESGSGRRMDRPELAKLLDYIREGDTVVVWKMDRLSRSLSDLVMTMNLFDERGVDFISLTEKLDTTTPSGRLVFHVFGAVAQFECDLIRERTQAGLQAAREQGKISGRPRKLTNDQRVLVWKLYTAKENTVTELARLFGVSRATIYRVLGEHERANLEQTASDA